MSSQCKAQTISGETLTKCTETTTGEFCDSHKHKHRLEKPDECAVCLEKISSETETPLECGHWIHKKCIVPTNLHKCPLCNIKMTEQETEYVFGTNHREQNNYNDGNSIYWTEQGELEMSREIEEQGLLNEENIVNRETIEILHSSPFMQNGNMRRFIVNQMSRIDRDELENIAENIGMFGNNSPFIRNNNIMNMMTTDIDSDFNNFKKMFLTKLLKMWIEEQGGISTLNQSFENIFLEVEYSMILNFSKLMIMYFNFCYLKKFDSSLAYETQLIYSVIKKFASEAFDEAIEQ